MLHMEESVVQTRANSNHRAGLFRSRRHAVSCLAWVCALGAWAWYGVIKFGLLVIGGWLRGRVDER